MVVVKDIKDVVKEDVKGVEGVKIQWVWSEKDNVPNFYFRILEIEPGSNTPYHQHPWEHEVFVLDGKGAVKSEKGEIPIEAGKSIYVPPDELHQFINKGDSVLRFICIIPKS